MYAASTYAKIIISELLLPESEKTVKPAALGGLAGGTKYVVQNIMFKFVLDFELKPGLWMYGTGDQRSDENAMKSASHELKGLMSWYSCNIRGLCFPLQALVDYKGFRVLAISILPINDDSIIYGSSDAGRTVHSRSPDFNEKIDTAARILNLKPHFVNPTVQLSGPGDLEGHLGTDGKFYVLDAARTLPPEGPDENPEFREDRQVYYKLLRPEFVRKWTQPLCSDAFTSWQRYDPSRTENNLEVLKATKYLHERLIPEFAKRLDKMASAGTTFADESKHDGTVSEAFRVNRDSFAKKWAVIQDRRRTEKADWDSSNLNTAFVGGVNPVFALPPLSTSSSSSNAISPHEQLKKSKGGLSTSSNGKRSRGISMSQNSPTSTLPLTPVNSKDVETSTKELDIILMNEEMHRIGLNLRHLGEVRAHVKSDPPRQRILIEMVARVIKDLLRAHLRHKMREVRVLSEEPFKEVVIKVFNFALGRSVQSSSFWALVKTKLQRKYKSALSKLENEELDPMALCGKMDMAVLFRRLEHLLGITLTDSAREELESYPDSFEFVDSDVAEIYPKVKHMQIVDHAEGMALFLTAQKQNVGRRERLRQLRLSCEKFARALTTLPDSFTTLYQWGLALIEEAQMTGASFSAIKLYSRASEKFRSAVTINPQFQACFIKLGEAYIELARSAFSAAQNGQPLSLPELDDWEDSFREELATEYKTPPKSATKRYFIKATQAWERGLALPDIFFEEVYQHILRLHSDAVLSREPNRSRSRQLFYGSAILCEVVHNALNDQLLSALDPPAVEVPAGAANKYASSPSISTKSDSNRRLRSTSNPDMTEHLLEQLQTPQASTTGHTPLHGTSPTDTGASALSPNSAHFAHHHHGTSSPSTSFVFSSGISVAVPTPSSPSTTPRIKDVISVITPALKSRLQSTPSQILSSPYATGLGDEFAAMKPVVSTSPSPTNVSPATSSPTLAIVHQSAVAATAPIGTAELAVTRTPAAPVHTTSATAPIAINRAPLVPPLTFPSTPPKAHLLKPGFIHASIAVVRQAPTPSSSLPNTVPSDSIFGRPRSNSAIEQISLPASTWTPMATSNPNIRPVSLATRPSTIQEAAQSDESDSSSTCSAGSSSSSSDYEDPMETRSRSTSSVEDGFRAAPGEGLERQPSLRTASIAIANNNSDTSSDSSADKYDMKVSIMGTGSGEINHPGKTPPDAVTAVGAPLSASRSAGNLYHQGIVQSEANLAESNEPLVTPRKMRVALDAAPTPFRKSPDGPSATSLTAVPLINPPIRHGSSMPHYPPNPSSSATSLPMSIASPPVLRSAVLVPPIALSPSSSLLVQQNGPNSAAGHPTLRSVGLGVRAKSLASSSQDVPPGSPPISHASPHSGSTPLTIVAQPKPRRMRHSASVSSASNPLAPRPTAGVQLLPIKPTPQPTTSSTGQYYSGVAQEDEIQLLINLSSKVGQPSSATDLASIENPTPNVDKPSSEDVLASVAVLAEARFKPFLARSDSPPMPVTKPADKAEELLYLKRILLDILAIWSDSLIQYASLKSAGDEMLFLAGAVKLRDVLALDSSYLEIIQSKIIPELKYQARDNRRIHYVLAALHGVLHEHDPTNTQLVYDMGTSLHTYAQLHRLNPPKLELHRGEAAECFEEALNLDPSFADEMIHRAIVVQGALLEELLSIVEYSTAIETRSRLLWDSERLTSVSLASCSTVQDFTLVKLVSLCPKIQRLDLSRCLKVTDLGLQLISKRVKELKWLNLCECPGITDTGLQHFFQGQQQIGGCRLEMINLKGGVGITDAAVTAISHHCPSLTHLDLDHCKITNNAAATLAQYPLPRLSYLSFAFCVKLEDSGLAEMVKTRRFALQTIKLNGCNMISDAGIELLVNGMPSITELHLASIYRISNACMAEVFAKLPHLQLLDIRNCKGLTWDVFAHLPFDSCLTQLYAARMDPSGRPEDAQVQVTRRASKAGGMKAICEAIAPTLQSLDIAESHMPEEPLQELARSLTPNVTRLDLSACAALTDEIMCILAPRIPKVTHLNLNGCFQLTSRTTSMIANHCPLLRELFIARISENREPYILELIQSLPRLTKLDLSGNVYVSDNVLADIAVKLPSLDYLDVSATKITDKGLRLVCEHLVGLTSLSMASCLGITNDSLSWVAKHCRSLKELNISRCSITDQGLNSLADGVAVFRSLNLDNLSLITDPSLQNLIKLQDSLVELSLKFCTKITPECKMSLIKSYPELKIKLDPTNTAFVKELAEASKSIFSTRTISSQNIEQLIKANQAITAASSSSGPSELQSKFERIRRPKSDSVPPSLTGPPLRMPTPVYDDPAIARFTLSQLVQKDPATLNCNPECLELYLIDEEFQRYFGMSKTDFTSLVPWKKKQTKESLHLF